MPTKSDSDDRKLSALLNQTEPPRSPEHLDKLIINHARRKAEQRRELSSPGPIGWLGQNWKSTVSVFAVSAIALSVTLQSIDVAQPDLPVRSIAQAPGNQISFRDALVQSEEIQPASLGVEEAEFDVTAIDSSVINSNNNSPEPVQRSLQIELQETSQASAVVEPAATASLAPTPTVLTSAAEKVEEVATVAVNAVTFESAVDASIDEVIEEVVVTGSFIRRSSFAAASRGGQVDLSTIINADILRQQSFLQLLSEVLLDDTTQLAAPTSSTEASRQSLRDSRVLLQQAYQQLTEATPVQLSMEKYQQLKLGFNDFPLPETLEQAMDLVATLEF